MFEIPELKQENILILPAVPVVAISELFLSLSSDEAYHKRCRIALQTNSRRTQRESEF